MATAVAGVAGVFLIFLFFYFAAGVRIVRPYQKGIVENLGRYKETVNPGLRLLFPVFQKMRVVDMREQVADVPPQEVITKDNVVVSVDAVVYYEPTDPQRLIYNVASFILAITKLAQTNLRNLVGDMDLDSALTSRDQINTNLRDILDEATDKWGVRVGRVEIQRIDPPPDVMSAMHEQMKAERTRRAVVTQADGQRQAAIAQAEGEKQAAILSAEGVKQRQILEAEGQAQAMRAVAEAEKYRQQTIASGEADAIRSVYKAIHDGGPTTDLIAIKYLEALENVADGRATKIFLPAELSGVMGSIGGIAELFNNGNGDGGGGGGRGWGGGGDDEDDDDDGGSPSAAQAAASAGPGNAPPSATRTRAAAGVPASGPSGHGTPASPPPPQSSWERAQRAAAEDPELARRLTNAARAARR